MSENTDPITSPKVVGLGFDEALVGYDIGSRSEKEHNEDNYWPHEEDTTQYDDIDYLIAGRLYVVADGVSRGLAGHEASQVAAETISRRYYERILELEQPPTEDDLERTLRYAIMAANEALLDRSRQLRRKKGITDKKSYLQSAVICALLRGQRLIIANVGDCHLYRYRSKQVNLLYDPTRRSFVGTSLKRDQIEIHKEQIAEEDVLILCSDGLYKYLAPNNDPQRAPSQISDIFKHYYQSDGITQVARQLLSQANDEFSGGGGDNITVMLVKPGGALEPSAQNRLEPMIQDAWWLPHASASPVDLPPAITQLGQECSQKAKQLSLSGNSTQSKRWSRRAAQLGNQTAGLKELQRAQTLDYEFDLDFETNLETAKKIWKLYLNAPDNPELKKLTFDAVLDLANSALIPPVQPTHIEDIYRLIIEKKQIFLLHDAEKTQKTLSDLEKELKRLGSHTDQDGFADDKSRPKKALLLPPPPPDTPSTAPQALPSASSSSTWELTPDSKTAPTPSPSPNTRGGEQRTRRSGLSSPNTRGGELLPSPSIGGGAGGGGPLRGQKEPVRPRTGGNAESLLDKHIKKVVILISCITIISIISLFYLLWPSSAQIVDDVLTPVADITSDVSKVDLLATETVTQTVASETAVPSAMAFMTVTPEPSATAIPATPTVTRATPTAFVPLLKMADSTYNMMEIENGRMQIQLITHVSVQETSNLDTDVTIEVESRLPPGLSAIGSGSPEIEIKEDEASSEKMVMQRVPLNNVDPMNVRFESLYIIEWPHSRQASYTIPVTARLISADGVESYLDSKPIEIEPIAHQPAFSMTQSLSNTLVAIGDTILFNVTLTNTGQTWLDKLVIKPENMPAELNVDSNKWQKQLDGLGALEPGQTEQISLQAEVNTDQPGKLDPTLPIQGLLGDDTVVKPSSSPLELEIYAPANTSTPDRFQAPHPLRDLPGMQSSQNPAKAWLPNGTEVKVLESAKAEGLDWHFVEVMTSNQEPVRGWLWSERVNLEN